MPTRKRPSGSSRLLNANMKPSKRSMSDISDANVGESVDTGWGSETPMAARVRAIRNIPVACVILKLRHAISGNFWMNISDPGIEIRLQDYRDVQGQFDNIVSVEMFEAVGEAYWPSYFETLKRCLKPGGRVAILTFHSGEDRRVKKAFPAAHREGLLSAISDGVVTATPEERRLNPRSTPAKLRWATR